MRPYFYLAIVLLASIGIGIAVRFPNQDFVPIQQGNAIDFWKTSIGYQRDALGGNASVSQPYFGSYLYSWGHMHGANYYQVSVGEVYRGFPDFVDSISFEDEKIPNWAQWALVYWSEEDPDHLNPSKLLGILRQEKLKFAMTKDFYTPEAIMIEDMEFGLVTQRSINYHLPQFSEWAYLTAIVLFLFWPGIRSNSILAWSIHICFIPLLLLLPYYLGYCSWTFTSYGPGGGAVYPYLVSYFYWIPWLDIDSVIIRNTPQYLYHLTGPHGPIISLSGGRKAGPVFTMLLGFAIGSMFYVLLKIYRANSKLIAPMKSHSVTR